jgi:hypothetical protein
MLLATANDLYFYNMKTDHILTHHHFTGVIQSLGWISRNVAIIGTNDADLEDIDGWRSPSTRWYQLEFSADKLQRTYRYKGQTQPAYLPGAF